MCGGWIFSPVLFGTIVVETSKPFLAVSGGATNMAVMEVKKKEENGWIQGVEVDLHIWLTATSFF